MATHPTKSKIPLIAKLRERIISQFNDGIHNEDLTEQEIEQLRRILRPSEIAGIYE